MSGHNKWSKIKNKKGAEDIRKGKIFTKLGRNITVAVREGGKDPEYNPSLKAAIDKAKAENMPNDNIERAIKKGSGELDGQSFESLTYEGYGPGGIAIIVKSLTDNRNRTAGEMRHLFEKNGGNLGQDGSVSFMFDRLGVIVLDKEKYPDEEEITMDIFESGADDYSTDDEDVIIIYSQAEDFNSVRNYFVKKNYEFLQAELEYVPKTTQSVDEEDRELLERLMDSLEDNEDVQDVYSNVEE